MSSTTEGKRTNASLILRSVVPALRRPCAPSSLLLMASFLALLFAASNAQAGSYSGPIYSGSGAATNNVNNTPTAIPYASTRSGWGGSSGGVSSASCTGTIVATFTWQPVSANDPPPTQVVVTETCTASAGVQIPGMTGSYSTGLGTGPAPTGSVTAIPGHNNSVSGTSVRYTVQPGGGTVALPAVSPSASGGGMGSDCSVGYMAGITPVFVLPGGAIKDSSGSYNILIGQSCTASLSQSSTSSVSPFPSALVSTTPSSPTYQWTVSGTTFQSWSVVADPNNQSHTAEVDGYGTATSSSLNWYWNDPSSKTETIACTATVTPPSGQGSRFTVIATQKVTVYLPGWSCTGNGGTMQINSSFGLGNGSDLWLYAGPATGSTTGRGMDWMALVSAPSAPVSFGTGVLEMVQTETPNSTYISTTGAKYKRSNNGQQGLDSFYPYPWQTPTPAPPNYRAGDSPGVDLTAMSAASAQLQYKFVDCLMYEPPGSSQFVPLATYSWSTPVSSTGPVTPSGVTNFTKSNAFPSWSQNVGNGTWSWIPQ